MDKKVSNLLIVILAIVSIVGLFLAMYVATGKVTGTTATYDIFNFDYDNSKNVILLVFGIVASVACLVNLVICLLDFANVKAVKKLDGIVKLVGLVAALAGVVALIMAFVASSDLVVKAGETVLISATATYGAYMLGAGSLCLGVVSLLRKAK
jgi:hypothetical protein